MYYMPKCKKKEKKKKDKKRSIFGIKLFVIERVCRHVCKALIRVDWFTAAQINVAYNVSYYEEWFTL